MHEMLTGKPPFAEMEPLAAVFRIGSLNIPPKIPATFSASAREFLEATWKRCACEGGRMAELWVAHACAQRPC